MMVEGVDYKIREIYVGDGDREMICFAMGEQGVYNYLDTTTRRVNSAMSCPDGISLAKSLGELEGIRAWLLNSLSGELKLLVNYPDERSRGWRIWPAVEGTLAEAVARMLSFHEIVRLRDLPGIEDREKRNQKDLLQRGAWRDKYEAGQVALAAEASIWIDLPGNRERLLTLLRGLPRPIWVPVTDSGAGTPKGSRYGGLPWLNTGIKWPRSSGEVLSFILQLDISTLPIVAQDTLGQHSGLLQMFQGVGFTGKDTRILITPVDRDGDLREAPSIEDDRTPSVCAITKWVECLSIPDGQDYPRLLKKAGMPDIASWLVSDYQRLELLMREAGIPVECLAALSRNMSENEDYLENEYSSKDEDLSSLIGCPCDHLMGYPVWQQDETILGDGWSLLLEIWDGGPIGDLFTGDGSIYIFFKKTDKGLRFKTALQCG